MYKLIQTILLAALALLCCACIDEADPQGASQQGTRIQVGDTLPQFEVALHGGGTLSRDSLLGGCSVVVFFNTECPDCRRELPRIDSLYVAMRADTDFRLVCIAREDGAASVGRYWQQQGFQMPVSPQNDRAVFHLFAYSNVPRIYLSDARGVVRYIHDDQSMPYCGQLLEEVAACRTW